MTTIYVGKPAENYGAPGQTQRTASVVYAESDFDSMRAELEEDRLAVDLWVRAPWFVVASSGNFRRDVCVAGAYLRIVLRPSEGPEAVRWGVWVTPLDRKEGVTVPHGHKEAHPKAFMPVVYGPTPGIASLKYYLLFRPGAEE